MRPAMFVVLGAVGMYVVLYMRMKSMYTPSQLTDGDVQEGMKRIFPI